MTSVRLKSGDPRHITRMPPRVLHRCSAFRVGCQGVALAKPSPCVWEGKLDLTTWALLVQSCDSRGGEIPVSLSRRQRAFPSSGSKGCTEEYGETVHCHVSCSREVIGGTGDEFGKAVKKAGRVRIGIDARITYYARGGISNYVRYLLSALAALDQHSEYYVFYSRKQRAVPYLSENFRPIKCWTPSHHRLERWALGAEIARLQLALLHSPDFIPPAWGSRHVVITVHDLNFLHFPEFLSAESRRYYNAQIEWAVKRADHILADSYATRTDLIQLLDVPAERITVAHLAPASSFRVLPQAEVARVCNGYGLRPGYILFVGTLEPRKNVTGLLEAYRLLRQDNKLGDVPLVLVGGRGWLYEAILDRLTGLRLSEHVHMFHQVPDADLPALYNAAGVLVLPSFYEGFGLTALEAMACGTPVVVANRSSLPEVVGDAGLLVNPEDPADIAEALARVLGDETLRDRLRKAGLARAAQFTWDLTARKTWAVYRRVLGLEEGDNG